MRTRAGGFRLVLVCAIICGVTAAIPVSATQFAGGRGLTMVQFPTILDPGSLVITLHSRAFVTSPPGYAWAISDGTGALSFNFGFTKRVEIGFTQILYQDLNVSAAQNNYATMQQIPDDTYLRVKVGAFPYTLGNAFFKFGILNQLRYRTGLVQNVYLEPYSGDGIEWEIDLLNTLYLNPLYEDNAPAIHMNLGYTNFNDTGVGQSVFKAAQSIEYGLAFVYPTKHFDFFLETSGHVFTHLPPEPTAFSQQDYQWVTPGLRWKIFYGLNATIAMDIMTWKSKDRSTAVLPKDYPDFPNWRINGMVSISPSTSFYREPTFSKVSDPLSTRKLLRERKSLFEWVVDEQPGVEYIDLELEKIKAERKKAEQELEKLKKDLGSP
jgi:hypothetical protein